jgi:ribosomal protein S27AE
MLPLRDKIRAICHSLKMDPLTGIDPSREEDLRSRIKALPEAEIISTMARGGLEGIRVRTERLIFDIDNAKNSRTRGFALRNMVDKGLPPRRAPLLGSLILPNWFKKADFGTMEDEALQGSSKPGLDLPEGNFESDPNAMTSGGCPVCGNTSFRSVPSPEDPNRVVCSKCGATHSTRGHASKEHPTPTTVTDLAR